MATATEIDKALDEIAASIDRNRSVFNSAKNNITSSADILSQLPTEYADVISSINAYGTTDAYEAMVKARFAKYVTEFSALQSEIQAIADTL